jgi:hypothetical protein
MSWRRQLEENTASKVRRITDDSLKFENGALIDAIGHTQTLGALITAFAPA